MSAPGLEAFAPAHSDRRRLRQLYQGIAAQDGEDEAFHVSESSRDFMARVRINIMVDEAPEPDPRSGLVCLT